MVPTTKRQMVETSARFPEFERSDTRMRTFLSRWPNAEANTEIHILVEIGFYHTDNGTYVRCFHCGRGTVWQMGDDMLLQHVRIYSRCQHLENTVDPTRLGIYKLKADETENQNDTESSVSLNRGFDGDDRKAVEWRLTTFAKWRSKSQQSEKLAEAGFVYTGHGDRVRCYFCNGGLKDWHPNDDPWVEHARWFPDCPYIRQMKGDNYVDRVHQLYILQPEALSRHEPHCDRHQDTEQQTNGMALTWDTVEKAIVDRIVGREVLPVEPPDNDTVSGRDLQGYMDRLVNENRRLLQFLNCNACGEREASFILLPCGHIAVCENCVADVCQCPVCYTSIKDMVKVYWA